jgi:ferredoxin
MTAPVGYRCAVKIRVDEDRCTGHGICESRLPAVFEVGSDGASEADRRRHEH